jgi:hypothetical protein
MLELVRMGDEAGTISMAAKLILCGEFVRMGDKTGTVSITAKLIVCSLIKVSVFTGVMRSTCERTVF